MKRLASERAEIVAAVMGGQTKGEPFTHGMMLGRYNGLGDALNIIHVVLKEDAASRGDRM